MNKFSKLSLALALLMAVGIGTFTACADKTPDEGENPGLDRPNENPGGSQGEQPGENPGGTPGEVETNTFVMESEYVDFFGISGPGMSSSATETQMIMKDTTGGLKASNKFYVGYTHAPDITCTYEFMSDKATTATLVLRLGSDQGRVANYGNQALQIKINDDNFAFGSKFTLDSVFADYTISTEFPIKQGDNVLGLTVLKSDVFQASFGSFVTFGPLYDCVKIISDAKLGWEPLTTNCG